MAAEWEDQHVPTDPKEQRRLHAEMLRRWLRLAPEGGDEVLQQGFTQGLQHSVRHLFERRLRRPLDAAEQVVMGKRFVALGSDRLCDVVLDLPAEALAAWLADPAAR